MSAAVSVSDPPSGEVIARALAALAPLRRLIQPKVYGLDDVTADGALFVGNHTLMGLLDLPLILAELWERGVTMRLLGDHAHFKLPLWREFLLAVGVVDGTRAITEALMVEGANILVFPGGGREVSKLKGEQYQLIWKNRLGFARLAIKHDYPIVPFASVGAEESLDIVIDAENPALAPIRFAFEKITGSPDLWPVVRGVGPTPIPRPTRQYYWFGSPISTAELVGRHDDDRVVRRLRERVRRSVEGGIEFLQTEQSRDPEASLLKRILRPRT
ncbi:lysophospholipid acyltransferase family protein [Mycobacterium sp.]|uniref:lysophospholipid acyltransferase family protein n=1 Tax=Mycobacterium sp. TaxID=1785 RepID=UPI0025D629FD|nr:lysophospholipid acyltransferase family protein [Mycobacterium sp.]